MLRKDLEEKLKEEFNEIRPSATYFSGSTAYLEAGRDNLISKPSAAQFSGSAASIMDPNTSIERICLGEDNRISLNDGIESNEEWDTPGCHDTVDSRQRKAFTFYRMETEEISDRYIVPCFVNGLEAYDGEINLENDKNLISNEFVVNLCLEHEFTINPEEDDIKPGVMLGRSFMRLTKGIANFGNEIITIYPGLDPFNDDSDKTNESEDDWEPRPIIETRKFIDQHKKLLDSVMLDKLKLDGEVEDDEEEATKEVDSFALVDTGSNINVIPYHLYTKLGREDVKPVAKKITMLNHLKAEPMGILKDVLCQVEVTTILARFLILDMPMEKDVPIVNFYVVAVKSKEEKDNEDGEEYYVKRDRNGKPFYGPALASYLNCDDPLDRALALQETLNPFKKVCVWKKMVAFLGSLPVPLQHMEWIPLQHMDWHPKIRIVDPYGNVYDQGCETKTTKRELSKSYRVSDIMLPDCV
ncbi:DNA-directed DNA polymerase [Tanacetum coccineum]